MALSSPHHTFTFTAGAGRAGSARFRLFFASALCLQLTACAVVFDAVEGCRCWGGGGSKSLLLTAGGKEFHLP
jgi:hypothetical protein